MTIKNQNQRLNGFTPLSYIGSNPVQPPNFTMDDVSPTVDDSRGFNLGDWWLNTSDNSIWYLAASNGLTATWIQVTGSGTGLTQLTGDTGGPVFPLGGNINILGDGMLISIAGNPGTSTLTVSSAQGGFNLSLTGNSGGAVGPTAGNINVVGSGNISVTDNPGTSTLTINESGSVAIQYNTQVGNAVPIAGVLNVVGSNQVSTSGAGSTVTVTGGSALAQSFITSPPTGTAVPSANTITFAGINGTTISAGGSTVTFTSSGALPVFSTGSFTPFMAFGGSTAGIGYAARGGKYTRMGNLVSFQIWIGLNTAVPAGTASIGGLPFTVSNAYGSFFMETSVFGAFDYAPTTVNNPYYLWGRFNPGTTTMTIYKQNLNLSSSNATTAAQVDFNASIVPQFCPFFNVQGFYFV